jgi:hypothetical protein
MSLEGFLRQATTSVSLAVCSGPLLICDCTRTYPVMQPTTVEWLQTEKK